MFADEQLALLANEQPIDGGLPFNWDDDRAIRQFYEPLVNEIEAAQRLEARVEWNHYGSGYASFVDAWFYPADGTARVSSAAEHHMGLVVLLSRLSRYFVIGQGEKTWSKDAASSYLPCFDIVDNVSHPVLVLHIEPIANILASAGLVRLRRHDLAEVLHEKYNVLTVLSDPPYHQFDALFHWED